MKAAHATTAKYLIILERTPTGYSAYSPDVPGCIATGATRAETEHTMQKAIEFHLDGLALESYPVPEPTSDSAFVEVARAV